MIQVQLTGPAWAQDTDGLLAERDDVVSAHREDETRWYFTDLDAREYFIQKDPGAPFAGELASL